MYGLLLAGTLAFAQPAITEFRNIPGNPQAITAGPDGALWFAGSQIGRITTSGTATSLSPPSACVPLFGCVPNSFSVSGIVTGPDGALWFANADGQSSSIGRITTAGALSLFRTPSSAFLPYQIATGADGNLWFTILNFGYPQAAPKLIWRMTTAGVFTSYPTSGNPFGITQGPDGAIWFTEASVEFTPDGSTSFLVGAWIGRIDGNGNLTEFPITFAPGAITTGPDGALWFTSANSIGRMTTSGAVTTFPTPSNTPSGITSGPDGSLWFTDSVNDQIVRMTTSGTIVAFAIPTARSNPTAITTGPDGALWFVESVADKIGRVALTSCTFALSSSGQAFPSVGGAGNFLLTAPAGCPWAVSGLPNWVQIETGSSGSGSGSVSYFLGPNFSAAPLSATLSIGGQAFTIQQQGGAAPVAPVPIGIGLGPLNFMPHLAAEGGWRTMFTLVNTASTATDTSTVVYGDDGNLLSLPLTFPQQPSQGPVTEAWVNQALAPNQSFVFDASGPANVPFVQGSAQVWANSNGVDGFAIFHFDPSGQEAVVPLGGSGYAIPFDNTNGVLTGIAVENTSPSPGTFPVTLLDDTGAVIGTGTESITLGGYGHVSFVLSTQFPVTANIRGSVILGKCVFSPSPVGPGGVSCTPISTLGMRYTPPGTLTTIPALANAGTSVASMPHIASGNGWQTTFVLVNSNPGGLPPAQAQLNFFDDNGNPLLLPLAFPQTGTAATESSVAESIASGASLSVQTSGALGTALLTGSAQLTTTGGVSGFAIFRYNPNGQEAVVPLETRNASAYLLAFDNTNGTATGVAVANASARIVNVPVIVRDDTGTQIGMGSIPLAANGHTSFMLASQYPVTAGIRGTVEFDNTPGFALPMPTLISVLGIRSPPALTFTTLPALAK